MAPRRKRSGSEGDLAARLLTHALKRVEALGSSLPGRLGLDWGHVLAGWRAKLGEGGPEDLFLGSAGTPAFAVLAAVAEGIGLSGEEFHLRQAAEAMMLAYFEVRVQDDIVDGELPPSFSFLETALVAISRRLLCEASGDPLAMMDLDQDLRIEFAVVASWDAELRATPLAPWEDASVERLGGKYLPMVAPLATLLLRARQQPAIEKLTDGVRALGVALQLTNDLLGAAHDLEQGQGSPFLSLLKLEHRRHSARDLAGALHRALRAGDLDAHFDEIERWMALARARLAFLPGDRIARHVEARLVRLRQERMQLSLRAMMERPRLTLDLEITRRCPFSCDFCFVGAGPGGEHMPLEWITGILRECRAFRTTLHLTGGEPLAHPDLLEILAEARHSGVQDVVLNTTGHGAMGELLDAIRAIGLRTLFLVSLEGPPDLGTPPRGHEAREAALRFLEVAPSHGLQAEAASVLTEALARFGLRAWMEWIASQTGRPVGLTLWPLFLPAGRTSRFGRPVPHACREAVAREIANLVGEGLPVRVADGPTWNPLLEMHGVPHHLLWQCEAGRERLCVQVDGRVTPCHPLGEALTRIPPVEGFLDVALGHPTARCIADRAAPDCADCVHRALCGGCRAACAGLGAPLFSLDPGCPLRSPDSAADNRAGVG